ncbi:M23 family metallopeptidase [Salinimicrobium oceani]|uniref:M23 family metallopeptidase n=1 Tax=Salinimicrobium oceani TaxID=2722702 RepID=UPI001F25DBFC|nr:M23 family metallopeptidase [Salinimicrobium oceani]
MKKVQGLFEKPSAREKYVQQFDQDPHDLALWKKAFENAIFDSITVPLPYSEAGTFSPGSFPVYSYNFELAPGERLEALVATDSLPSLVFLDLYQQQNDSLVSYDHLKSAEFESGSLRYEAEEAGIYKLIVQPEISASRPFRIHLKKVPVYTFPVAGKGNANVQSFWGATRDGGRRSHEGIDIFAARGTPVIAAVDGRISSTGNKGLGGKQVWLRDRKRGNSLYYAHLDSIIATPGMNVVAGDTLGLVGNT